MRELNNTSLARIMILIACMAAHPVFSLQGASPCFGGGSYILFPEDIISVSCFIKPEPVEAYAIQINDNLRITFPGKDDYSMEQVVKPDGTINLPRLSSVKVAGLTLDSVVKVVSGYYEILDWNPEFFIVISQFDRNLRDVQNLFTQAGGGQQGRLFRVRPDGNISLPFIGELAAGGRSYDTVSQIIQSAYTRLYPRLAFDTQLTTNNGGKVYIFGKVAVPGAYTLSDVGSIYELFSRAGGVTNAASLKNVVLMNITDSKVVCRKIDAKAALRNKSGRLSDITVCPGTIVFVPQRPLYSASDFMAQLANILWFRGFYTGLTWDTRALFDY